MENLLEFAIQFIAALGGGAAVILVLAKYAGNIFADQFIEKLKAELNKDIETHRTRLNKSEKFFELEFEAASKFVSLRRKMMPKINSPVMDWHDACDEIALQFGPLENMFATFISDYGAVLSDNVIDKLSACIALAGENKFEAMPDGVSAQANSAASKLYDMMTDAENMMLHDIRSQIAK